jgi:hypothetical protein
MGLRDEQPIFFDSTVKLEEYEIRRRANLLPRERVEEWARLRQRGGLQGKSIKNPQTIKLISLEDK